MLEIIILTKRKYNMTFNLLNPTTHTSIISFDSIPQIITYLKTLNLPSSEQYLIFPTHNKFHFLFTLNQLIKHNKNHPFDFYTI